MENRASLEIKSNGSLVDDCGKIDRDRYLEFAKYFYKKGFTFQEKVSEVHKKVLRFPRCDPIG